MRFFALFLFLLCIKVGHGCSVNEFSSATTGLCCNLCPPGKYMSKECTQDSQTTCQECPKNEFTSVPNNLTSCGKCSSVACDGGRLLLQRCTRTSDIQCVCPANTYWNTHTLRCEDCTACNRGQKIISRCLTFKDAECEECPKGTYLDKVNNKCVLCSYCHKGEVVEEECTIWADTICRKEKIQVFSPSQKTDPQILIAPTKRTPKLPSPVLQKTTDCRSQKDDASKPADLQEGRTFHDSVTWASLAVNILFVLCGTIFFSWTWIRRDDLKMKTQTPNGNASRTDPKASVVSNLNSSETIKENNRLFCTLPATVTEEVASYLNAKQGKNWKHLAGLMGYKTVFTQNLELTPVEATQKLLHDWEHSSEATVYRLFCFLQELGRDDATAVLVPFLTTQGGSREEFV